jgi:hypothetical protein
VKFMLSLRGVHIHASRCHRPSRGIAGSRAAQATTLQAFDPTFLVCADLTSDRYHLTESQMCYRRKESPVFIVRAEVNLADYSALVTGVIDASDCIPPRAFNYRGLLSNNGDDFRSEHGDKRQRFSQLEEETFNLFWIVDHGGPRLTSVVDANPRCCAYVEAASHVGRIAHDAAILLPTSGANDDNVRLARISSPEDSTAECLGCGTEVRRWSLPRRPAAADVSHVANHPRT